MKTVGIGTRVLNFMVDTLLFSLLAFIAYKVWSFYVVYWQVRYLPFYFFFYTGCFVYYVFFESIFARTPGKWLSISKVVNKAGRRPGFFQVCWRSLLRLTIIDCFFIPFLDKTLHDALSKTEVVEA